MVKPIPVSIVELADQPRRIVRAAGPVPLRDRVGYLNARRPLVGKRKVDLPQLIGLHFTNFDDTGGLGAWPNLYRLGKNRRLRTQTHEAGKARQKDRPHASVEC